MTQKLIRISLALILVAWAAPLVVALTAGGVASALGCELDEGAVHKCLVFGADIGGTLYTLGVMGWLSIIGIPFALGALAIWVVVSLLVSRRRGAN